MCVFLRHLCGPRVSCQGHLQDYPLHTQAGAARLLQVSHSSGPCLLLVFFRPGRMSPACDLRLSLRQLRPPGLSSQAALVHLSLTPSLSLSLCLSLSLPPSLALSLCIFLSLSLPLSFSLSLSLSLCLSLSLRFLSRLSTCPCPLHT